MVKTYNLSLGSKYSKKDLVPIFSEPQIAKVREGIYNLKNDNIVLLFVNLDKGQTNKNLHYNDFFDGETFHWDSQNKQHINTPGIQKIVSGERSIQLFVRIKQKIKNVTQPFIYCGELEYIEYEPGTSNPVHIIFRSKDFLTSKTISEDLQKVYSWRPENSGRSSDPRFIQKPPRTSYYQKTK